jgi:hypothetical protein
MNSFGILAALSVTLIGWTGTATADPWKDESGKGRWRGGYERGWDDGERKVKFRTSDGCKVERKWKAGEFEEKIKCKRG